jgi:UDP-N-acetyl-D-mannosaminuronate dehydrogenase
MPSWRTERAPSQLDQRHRRLLRGHRRRCARGSAGDRCRQPQLAAREACGYGIKFLQAGPGFGGSCFQKDILNLVYLCRHYGLEEVAAYWEQVVTLNTWQQHRIARLVVNRLFGTVTGKRIGVLGFAYGLRPTASTRPTPTTRA